MNSEVRLLIGPARAGKTARALSRYGDLVHGGSGGNVLFLLPTALAVDQIKERLVADGVIEGLFNPNVVEFYGLVNRIIARNVRDAREISHAEQHAILTGILSELDSTGDLIQLSPSLGFSGFIGALQNFIADLKEATVEPETFLSLYSSGGGKEYELALIYHRYQKFLTGHSLFDSQGKLWRGSQLIKNDKMAPFEDVREVIVDGFADFTPAEFDIIRALGERCERMTFTLMCERGRRRELFESTLTTLELIRSTFKNASIETVSAPGGPEDPLAVLESRLFDDEAADGVKCEGAVEMAELPSRAAEVTEIGRRIKRMIVEEGRSPADIAVLVRRLDVYDGLVQEIFSEQGIPFHIRGKRPVSRIPGLRPVIQLARLPVENYSRKAVCRFLKSVEDCAPDFKQMRHPAEVLDVCAREAGIVEGLASWPDRLKAYRAQLQARVEGAEGSEWFEDDDPQKKLPLAETAVQIAEKLFPVFENLEKPGTLSAYARTFLQMLERFGLRGRPGTEAETEPDSRAANRQAVDVLFYNLGQIARLPGDADIEADYNDFLAQFRAILGMPVAWSRGDRTCVVTIADVSEARNTSFPVVFIPGMSEGEFPKPVLQNAFLNDAERRRIKVTGGPGLPETAEEQMKEMPLFYNAVTRAREKLIFTCPALDASGREVRRSWYLDEVEKLFDDVNRERREAGRVAPPESAATNRREASLVVVALAQSNEGVSKNLYCLPATDVASLADRIAVCEERDSLRPFGRYDGVLDDAKAVAILRSELESAVFSVNKLDDYLKCPFNYFCKRVLGLEELPEPAAEMTPMDRGSHCHEILRRFYSARAGKRDGTTAVTPDNLDEAEGEMSEICGEYFDSHAKRGLVRHREIFAIEREQITKELLALLKYESGRSGVVPSHFEWAFGFKQFLPGRDAASVPETLDIPCGEYTARIRGFVDRIDDCENGRVIIDYKTGSHMPAVEQMVAGLEIQLPVYAMAADGLLGEGPRKTREAFFISVRAGKGEKFLKNDKLARAIETARQSIAQCLAGIAGGRFPSTPSIECRDYCPCKEACKFDRRRMEKKT
ncbi:MAG: PD-(D/E)XK nuclease family protein [Planctomycetota bacterium]